jgi:hypothetical protein
MSGAQVTGPEHYRRAEELAAEAHGLLGQADGQATASVWAAVAQAHAVLALAAATAVGASGADHRAWADARRDQVLIRPRGSLTHRRWSGHDRLGARFSVREQAAVLPVRSPAVAR